jgi:hypothetical protein
MPTYVNMFTAGIGVCKSVEWYLYVCFRLSEGDFCVLHILKADSCVFPTVEEGLTVFHSFEGLYCRHWVLRFQIVQLHFWPFPNLAGFSSLYLMRFYLVSACIFQWSLFFVSTLIIQFKLKRYMVVYSNCEVIAGV